MKLDIFPGLPDAKWGKIDLDEESRKLGGFDFMDPIECSRWLKEVHKEKGIDFSYGGFLEDRNNIWKDWKDCEVKDRSKGLIHLGVDYNVPAGTDVFMPADGRLINILNDLDQKGGCGGMALFQIIDRNIPYYLAMAHLKQPLKLDFGRIYSGGEWIGQVGDVHENGGWFPHIHAQLMDSQLIKGYKIPGTGRLKSDWKKIVGYASEDDPLLKHIIDPSIFIKSV